MDFNTLFSLLPEKLRTNLDKKDKSFASRIWKALETFQSTIEHDLSFFPEYTDHGINHFINVLQCIEILTEEKTLENLTSKEIGILFLSVILHDIGMHTNEDMFAKMIARNGCYNTKSKGVPQANKYLKNYFEKDKKWSELWQEYQKDFIYWNDNKKKNVLGQYYTDEDHVGFEERLSKRNLTTSDRMFIGEFLRIHHCRIAYEVALYGYFGKDKEPLKLDGIQPIYLQMAGLIARSHGMKLREMYHYLDAAFHDDINPRCPDGINVIFLMVLVRLADYLHLENRTDSVVLKLRSLNSPVSVQEHEMHDSIESVQYSSNTDPEKIHVKADPKNARIFVKIVKLVEDLQNEFDVSWAVLGENRIKNKPYNLQYRRITTNLSNIGLQDDIVDYVPKEFRFRFNNEVAKLLVGPLYDNNPSYAVRELVQNAVDACRERKAREGDFISSEDNPDVKVTIDEITNDDGNKGYLFQIVDNGKGMTLDEIEKYFLTIGSSYTSSTDWKKFRDNNNDIFRAGRFGIGVLAAFLLGPEIEVSTRSMNEEKGYIFKATLESSFIEIKKAQEEELEVGTTITIQCDKESYEKLKEQAKDDNQSRDYWYNWYINDIPIVKYFLCHQQLFSTGIEEDDQYNDLITECPGFENIRWKPFYRFKGLPLDWCPSIYCNGFFISNVPKKRKFSIQGLKNFYPSMMLPSLLIEDKNNLLPINLQRSNIDENFKYVFEEALAKEVLTTFIEGMIKDIHVRDLIARKYDRKKTRRNIYFYLCPEGYALNCEYSNKKLSGRTLVTIAIESETQFKNQFKEIISYICRQRDVVFQFLHISIEKGQWGYDTAKKLIESINKDKLIENFSYNIKKISANFFERILEDTGVTADYETAKSKNKAFKLFYSQEDKKELMEDIITKLYKNLNMNVVAIAIGKIQFTNADDVCLNNYDATLEKIAQNKYPNGGNPIIPYDKLLESLKE